MADAIPGGGGAPRPVEVSAGGQPVTLQRDAGGYRGAHPVAAFFHFTFKGLPLLIYLIAGVSGISYMAEFIAVCMLLAADFWTTKNVTGRLLVALRWWNHVAEDGESEWVFESHPQADNVNTFDKYFFWILTIGVAGVWWLLVIFSLTSFGKLPLTVLGAILSTVNAVGFVKCSRDADKKVSDFLMRKAMENPNTVANAANKTAVAATVVASAAHAQAAQNPGGPAAR